MNQNQNLKLLKKIHEAAGGKSRIAIMRDWTDIIPELEYQDKTFFDRMFSLQDFIKEAKRISELELEDTYFSINSFRGEKKQTSKVWHLNAFVLDFDYYKIKKYQKLSAKEMYEQHIKAELQLQPTAVIDSGRGLYVIYSFKNACKLMTATYKSIYKGFKKRLSKYGLDPNAMNVTQVIRVPGSLNTKSLTPVEILQFNDTKYEMKDFYYLFDYSREEVMQYKNQKEQKKHDFPVVTEQQIAMRYKFREEQTAKIIIDMRKLIELRNAINQKSGYREELIYIVRKRIHWKGGTIKDELEIAHELNKMFLDPLTDKEIEQNCTPYGVTKCCRIDTIIEKLEITAAEQQYMSILRKKTLKDAERAKKKRILKLLNMTEKQKSIMQRRTNVAKLKNQGKRNVMIAKILTVDKSTVTRDLRYIKEHANQFIKKLRDAMKELKLNLDDFSLLKKIKYDDQQSLRAWMSASEILLE